MFLRDDPDTSSERQARMPELLEDYKERRVRLVSQARELERLREQVRASAEREAAAIVTTARRNVRQVLLDARRELLVLVAQVQAVGCDTPAEGAGKYVVEGEVTTEPVAPGAFVDGDAGSEIVDGARRDVREVLIEAQTELLALAEEARELRARIAKQHGGELEVFPSEHAAVADVPEPVAPPPRDTAPQIEIADTRAAYSPVSPLPRVWIPIAAAVLFAAVGVVLFLWSSGRDASAGAAVTRSAAASPPPRSAEPAARPPRPVAAPVSPAASDPSVLAVTIDVRRPAWIRTTIDGRADVGRLFNAGDTRRITAREEIVMRAGDAGAVFVSVNGSEARPLGHDGRVVTRRFGSPTASAPRPAVLQATAVSASTAQGSGQNPSADVGTTGTRDAPAAAPEAAEREILRAAQQWFEAYFSGDAPAMKHIEAADFSIVDDRAAGQRLSATMSGVERGLQQVRIDVAGEGAVMSARLMERATIDGQLREYVALVSGVWLRTEGRWRLTGLRLIDPASVRPL